MISLRPYGLPTLREMAPLTGRLFHRPSEMSRQISASHRQGLLSQQRLFHKPSLVKDKPRQGPKFDLQGKVYVITGGRRGLGLTMAEAIAQRGAKVHCFDRLVHPDPEFSVLQRETEGAGGSLHYHYVDVRSRRVLDQTIADLVSKNGRIDGLVAAAGVQRAKAAIDYTSQEVSELLHINYTGGFMSANAVARQMIRHRQGGSIVLVASMSGLVANKGLNCAVYNSPKAAVIQLARDLAMDWGRSGIRVNALCPGHIITPMVQQNLAEVPGAEADLGAREYAGSIGCSGGICRSDCVPALRSQ